VNRKKKEEKLQNIRSGGSEKIMLDFYHNLNINSGMLNDIDSDKNSLSCMQAGKRRR
jgi:hypothetical protein